MRNMKEDGCERCGYERENHDDIVKILASGGKQPVHLAGG
jgi:hypothetical protein